MKIKDFQFKKCKAQRPSLVQERHSLSLHFFEQEIPKEFLCNEF
jgi:hypothetical protein